MSQIRWDELSEARQLARLGKSLSRAARTRLQWMLFYLFNGRNAARTCRHFGISRQTFYRWRRRFDRHDLTTLEGRSHRPRRVVRSCRDRKSTRLNSSHTSISYASFSFKKKTNKHYPV